MRKKKKQVKVKTWKDMNRTEKKKFISAEFNILVTHMQKFVKETAPSNKVKASIEFAHKFDRGFDSLNVLRK